MRQQLHIPTQMRSRLSFSPAISLCNEPPMLCHHITLQHQREFSLTYTMSGIVKKIWNGANAQGKYNTISTSTVARHLWSQQNTKSTVLFFCPCNHFMQVKWYSMFILSCKVVRVCLLNEGWIQPGYILSFSTTASSDYPLLPPSLQPSTLCCATPVNIRVHRIVVALTLLQIHFRRQKWIGDYYPVVQFHMFSVFLGKCRAV